MRGDPLHLCCKGHGLIMYIGAVCPFCAALKEIADLKEQLAVAIDKLGQVAE